MPVPIRNPLNSLSMLRILTHYAELRRNQWLKLEELREIQNRKLRALIKYSYENVEFYHKRMKALGLGPNDVRTVDDLRKLPITTRSDIQKNSPAAIISRRMKNARLQKHTTSGSTCAPITVLSDSKT